MRTLLLLSGLAAIRTHAGRLRSALSLIISWGALQQLPHPAADMMLRAQQPSALGTGHVARRSSMQHLLTLTVHKQQQVLVALPHQRRIPQQSPCAAGAAASEQRSPSEPTYLSDLIVFESDQDGSSGSDSADVPGGGPSSHAAEGAEAADPTVRAQDIINRAVSEHVMAAAALPHMCGLLNGCGLCAHVACCTCCSLWFVCRCMCVLRLRCWLQHGQPWPPPAQQQQRQQMEGTGGGCRAAAQRLHLRGPRQLQLVAKAAPAHQAVAAAAALAATLMGARP